MIPDNLDSTYENSQSIINAAPYERPKNLFNRSVNNNQVGQIGSNRRDTTNTDKTTGSNTRLDYANLSEMNYGFNDRESNYTAKQSIMKQEQKFN